MPQHSPRTSHEFNLLQPHWVVGIQGNIPSGHYRLAPLKRNFVKCAPKCWRRLIWRHKMDQQESTLHRVLDGSTV